MRYVIEVYRSPGGVQGHVVREGCDKELPFHGWLELLALLEPPAEAPDPGGGPPASTVAPEAGGDVF